MGNVPETVQETANELNSIISSFISRHPSSLRYRTTEDGYSIFTIKYGKYRETEINKVKDFVENTEYDELLSIEGIPITCIKVNNYIMVFKGKKSDVEEFILNNNIDDQRLQEKIQEKVKPIDYPLLRNNINNLYNEIKNSFMDFISHKSYYNNSIIKNMGLSFNDINDKNGQIILNIEKFNNFYKKNTDELNEYLNSINSGNQKDYDVDYPSAYIPPNNDEIRLPEIENVSDIEIVYPLITLKINFMLEFIKNIKDNFSSVKNVLNNNDYNTPNDNYYFNIVKSTDTVLVIEYIIEKYKEKHAFNISDFNLRHLRWYELEDWFGVDKNGIPLENPGRVLTPNYPAYKLNPRFRENGIVLPDELPEDFEGDIFDYIEQNIFIPIEFGVERYNKNEIYLTPTRYTDHLSSSYILKSYKKIKEILNNSNGSNAENEWRTYVLDKDVSLSTIVDSRDFIGYKTYDKFGNEINNPEFELNPKRLYFYFIDK